MVPCRELRLSGLVGLTVLLVAGCGSRPGDLREIEATVSGLVGTGLVLTMNGASDTVVSGNGTVALASVPSGTVYEVAVKTQPVAPVQTCTVTNGSGTADAHASPATVVCVTNPHSVGGRIDGLAGSGLVLSLNGQELAISHGDSTFTFANGIEGGATYSVTVKTPPTPLQACTVVNGAGKMGDTDVTNVIVTCHEWGAARLIEADTAGGTTSPQVAVDSAGNAIAVWSRSDDTSASIWANRYVAGSGWGTAQLIEGNGGDAAFPQAAMDLTGNAIAVWRQDDGTRTNIWSNRYMAGNGWSMPQLIENDNTGSAYDPHVAMDSGGNAIAVWSQSDEKHPNIWTNRYVAGSGWGMAQLIEVDDTGSASSPRVAMDPSGNAMAVWSQSDGKRSNIWANRYAAGGGWGAAQLIESDDVSGADSPRVATDPSGNAIAVWSQSDGKHSNIWANRYVAGKGWGTAQLIESDDVNGADSPQVAMDSAGNAIVVWRQYVTQSDVTSAQIWANRYLAGTGWGTAQRIENDNAVVASSPQVAMDPAGNAIAVWYRSDVTTFSICSNRYVAGAGWGTTQLIENDNTRLAMDPQVAMDPAGSAIAVWRQDDGTSTRGGVWSNRY